MFAVVRTGGKQYRVAVNDVLRIETLSGNKGDAVDLGEVLMVSQDDKIQLGDAVKAIKVTGTILHQGRDTKVLVFKKRRRKNYRRTQGHRQNFTEVRVTSIQ